MSKLLAEGIAEVALLPCELPDICHIEFDVQAHRDARGALQQPIEITPDIPARLQYVSGSAKVFFKGDADVSTEQLHLLGEQTEARCPVANMMMASGCIMDIHWENGSSS